MRNADGKTMRKAFQSVACALVFAIPFANAGEEAPPAPLSAFETQIKAGREAFQKREYHRALAYFERALTYAHNDRGAQYLAGMAAYWARDHKRALDYFNTLLKGAARDSDDEWRIESARLMTYSAQGEHEAAEAVAQRLYELRRKLPQTEAYSGFVREHFFLNATEGATTRRFRVGAWEVIDPRGEFPDLWTFPIVSLEGAHETVVRTLRVESASLPGGGAGFAFVELENKSRKHVFKYWVKRPEYAEVRNLARRVLTGEQEPLKDDALQNLAKAAASAAGPAQPSTVPEPTVRVFSQKDLDSASRIARMGLSPTAAQILTLSARLKDVEFDVTRLTRAALIDPKDADRVLEELRRKTPFAPEDAAELVDLISKAKTEDVNTASENVAQLGPRKPYLDYALLTAFNTRGKDVPVFFLRETLQSADALVRQTAALMLARYGERAALELLFKDLAAADATGCAMIHGWLEELFGNGTFPPPPPPAREGDPPALVPWKERAAEWWKQHGAKLKHSREPQPGEPYWN